MTRDALRLDRWGPRAGSGWVECVQGMRPTLIEARFFIGDPMAEDELVVDVSALGSGVDLQITDVRTRFVSGEPLRPEDARRVDFDALAAALAPAVVVEYLTDPVTDRTHSVRFGGGPWMAVSDVRRMLKPGAPMAGPPKKVPLDQVAKVWRGATMSRQPAARTVAEVFGVSVASAHRYIAAARQAGLIEEKK